MLMALASMLPANHLVQLIPRRAESATRRLNSAIWLEMTPLEVRATMDGPSQIFWQEAEKLPLHSVVSGSHWGKLFDQRLLPAKS